MQIRILPYIQELQKDWDNLIENSINASLIHFRNYMQYHQDRFVDCSACIFLEDNLVAVFPAEIQNGKIFSHRGLTFGGPIFLKALKPTIIQEIITELKLYFKALNSTSIQIHLAPVFYWKNSLAYYEMQGVLASCNFLPIQEKVYQTVSLPISIKDRGKIWGKKKAEKHHLRVNYSSDLAFFWENILIPNLRSRFNANPTHTLEEISFLHKSFPGKIQLWAVFKDDNMLGGCLTFSHGDVLHVQYIGATEDGKSHSALDLLFYIIIEKSAPNYKYLSMGVSTNPINGLPNQGLVKWKKSWGASEYSTPSWESEL
ncbi:GNAT family N-acetyltransferase [Cognataquiflexum aquatile]|uniref:GNAT family N-acetyltransferase n=1 Tax=Cognataquiflexum aquatile TaxID=2249427 RepID=UPI000DE925EB|nr:GNAT family N-acetyltransferase [Cognataquiflexum aquatile]